MADFNTGFPYIALHEGGYCDIPGDAGGETYIGIARNSHPDWQGWQFIDDWKGANGIPPYGHIWPVLGTQVEVFYKASFWDEMKGDEINDEAVAVYFFDWFVNSGHKAISKLQQLLGIDPSTGNFGPLTLAKVNAAADTLISDLHACRMQFYNNLAAAVPSDAKFLKGWHNRSTTLYEILTS